MINPELLEDNRHFRVPEGTQVIRKAYCGNCGQSKTGKYTGRECLVLKRNARSDEDYCPDCKHALYWKWYRVNKICEATGSSSQLPHKPERTYYVDHS